MKLSYLPKHIAKGNELNFSIEKKKLSLFAATASEKSAKSSLQNRRIEEHIHGCKEDVK